LGLKQLSFIAQKIKNEKEITVNTGPVMFSGEIYSTDPLS